MHPAVPSIRPATMARAVALAWLTTTGLDFFFNASLLAALWEQPSLFLLPVEDLFMRIPLGYGAFLLWAALVVWLVARLGIQRPIAGAFFATKIGALISVSGVLALVSISTIGATLAVAWAATQVAEFTVMGYVGTVVLQSPAKPVWPWTLGIVFLLFIAGLIAQNL